VNLDITAIDVVAWSILHALEHRLLNVLQVLVVALVFGDETARNSILSAEIAEIRRNSYGSKTPNPSSNAWPAFMYSAPCSGAMHTAR
jgi:hypothetical protein